MLIARGLRVRLENFEGPFDLLLQLISKHKMDVTEVALSRVTDEFLDHLKAHGKDWDLDQTSQFIVVAATLLDLKAARLIPSVRWMIQRIALLEARDLLFARLLQYRAFKQVAAYLASTLDGEGRRYPRQVGLEPRFARLLPEVTFSISPDEFAALGASIPPETGQRHLTGAPACASGHVREQAGLLGCPAAPGTHLDISSTHRRLPEPAHDRRPVPRPARAVPRRSGRVRAADALGELTVRWIGTDAGELAISDEFDDLVSSGPTSGPGARDE